MKRYLFALFLFLTSASQFALVADETVNQKFPFPVGYELESTQNSSKAQEVDKFQDRFFHMLYILALLIGFMIVASWLIKKLMRTRTEQLNTTSLIRVIETRPLSTKATLHIIDINGKGILIAETHTKVTKLGEVDLDIEK